MRENRERIEHQIANLRAQLAGGESQLLAAQGSLDEWRGRSAETEERVSILEAVLAEETSKLPVAEEAYRASNNRRDELQRGLSRAPSRRCTSSRRSSTTLHVCSISWRSAKSG